MITVLCPTCRDRKVPRVEPTFPFCSPSCRDRDLLGWTEERYKIEGARATAEDLDEADGGGEPGDHAS